MLIADDSTSLNLIMGLFKNSMPLDLIISLFKNSTPLDLIISLFKNSTPLDLIMSVFMNSTPLDLIMSLFKNSTPLDLITSLFKNSTPLDLLLDLFMTARYWILYCVCAMFIHTFLKLILKLFFYLLLDNPNGRLRQDFVSNFFFAFLIYSNNVVSSRSLPCKFNYPNNRKYEVIYYITLFNPCCFTSSKYMPHFQLFVLEHRNACPVVTDSGHSDKYVS